jgi:prepilin-type N-terminal cleavage/methylation domain-containing protein
MKKRISGFTVVELLLVIVIIGILASITVIGYNGTQQRARAAQTVATAEQWIKGLMIYKARNGTLPAMSSCLGSGYKYNHDGLGASGIGQCAQTSASLGVVSDSAFSTAISPYMNGSPTPAMVSAVNSSTSWYRGLVYQVNSTLNTAQLLFTLDKGQPCPLKLGDYVLTSSTTTTDADLVCTYNIGSTVSFDFS